MATVDQDLRFELQERNQDRKRLHDQLGQENRGGLSLEQADRLKLFFKRRKPSEVLAMSDQEKRDYDAERRKAVREMTEAQARAHEALRKRRVVEGYEAGLDRVIAKFRRNKKRDMRNVSKKKVDQKVAQKREEKRITLSPEPRNEVNVLEGNEEAGVELRKMD